jgi:hypothetical protein
MTLKKSMLNSLKKTDFTLLNSFFDRGFAAINSFTNSLMTIPCPENAGVVAIREIVRGTATHRLALSSAPTPSSFPIPTDVTGSAPKFSSKEGGFVHIANGFNKAFGASFNEADLPPTIEFVYVCRKYPTTGQENFHSGFGCPQLKYASNNTTLIPGIRGFVNNAYSGLQGDFDHLEIVVLNEVYYGITVRTALTTVISSTTAFTVTIPSNPIVANMIGKQIALSAYTGTGALATANYTITSISGNNVTFSGTGLTVGNGTCTLTYNIGEIFITDDRGDLVSQGQFLELNSGSPNFLRTFGIGSSGHPMNHDFFGMWYKLGSVLTPANRLNVLRELKKIYPIGQKPNQSVGKPYCVPVITFNNTTKVWTVAINYVPGGSGFPIDLNATVINWYGGLSLGNTVNTLDNQFLIRTTNGNTLTLARSAFPAAFPTPYPSFNIINVGITVFDTDGNSWKEVSAVPLTDTNT